MDRPPTPSVKQTPLAPGGGPVPPPPPPTPPPTPPPPPQPTNTTHNNELAHRTQAEGQKEQDNCPAIKPRKSPCADAHLDPALRETVGSVVQVRHLFRFDMYDRQPAYFCPIL